MDHKNISHRQNLEDINISSTMCLTLIESINEQIISLRRNNKVIINVSVGQPSLPIPQFLQEIFVESVKSTNKEVSLYTDKRNEILRSKIIRKFEMIHSTKYPSDKYNSGYSNGATQALVNAITTLIMQCDDEIIIPSPYWDGYQEVVDNVGRGIIRQINCIERNEWKITPDQLENAINDRTACFVLTSPSNPTGATYNEKELFEIANVLRQNQHVTIICDEVYRYFIYDQFAEKAPSLLEVAPDLQYRIISVDSLSKTYSVCGHRIGYYIGPRKIIDKMNIVQSNGTEQLNSIAQEALSKILDLEIIQSPLVLHNIRDHREFYKNNIILAIQILNQAKYLQINRPNGAFYLFVNFTEVLNKTLRFENDDSKNIIIKTDRDFYLSLLEFCGVSVRPGFLFGDGYDNYFRLSCAGNTKELERACIGIVKFTNSLVSTVEHLDLTTSESCSQSIKISNIDQTIDKEIELT